MTYGYSLYGIRAGDRAHGRAFAVDDQHHPWRVKAASEGRPPSPRAKGRPFHSGALYLNGEHGYPVY